MDRIDMKTRWVRFRIEWAELIIGSILVDFGQLGQGTGSNLTDQVDKLAYLANLFGLVR